MKITGMIVLGLVLVGVAGVMSCKSTVPGMPWAEATDTAQKLEASGQPKVLEVTDQGMLTRTLHIQWEPRHSALPTSLPAGYFYADVVAIDVQDRVVPQTGFIKFVDRFSVKSWSDLSKASITEIDLTSVYYLAPEDSFSESQAYRIVFTKDGKVLTVLNNAGKPV